MEETSTSWTEYMVYRLRLRGYDLKVVENILRYSSERYADTATGREVAIGQHEKLLVMVPYERDGSTLTPVTVHATSRSQINARIKSGRFI